MSVSHCHRAYTALRPGLTEGKGAWLNLERQTKLNDTDNLRV